MLHTANYIAIGILSHMGVKLITNTNDILSLIYSIPIGMLFHKRKLLILVIPLILYSIVIKKLYLVEYLLTSIFLNSLYESLTIPGLRIKNYYLVLFNKVRIRRNFVNELSILIIILGVATYLYYYSKSFDYLEWYLKKNYSKYPIYIKACFRNLYKKCFIGEVIDINNKICAITVNGEYICFRDYELINFTII